MPGWKIREASSGETALRLVDDEEFDLLFLDQYMSSAEKQLLGTETARKLRSKGVSETIICGLSANDMGRPFIKAGADIFLMKPFPCKSDELKSALVDVLHTRGPKYFSSLPNDPDAQKVSFNLPDLSERISLALPTKNTKFSEGNGTTTKPKPSSSSSSLKSSSQTNSSQTDVSETPAPLFSLKAPAPLFSLAATSAKRSEENSPLLQAPAPLFSLGAVSTKNSVEHSEEQSPLLLNDNKNEEGIVASSKPLWGNGLTSPPTTATTVQRAAEPTLNAVSSPAPLFQLAPSQTPSPLFQLNPGSESTVNTPSEKSKPLWESAPPEASTAAATTSEDASGGNAKPAPLW